MVFIKLDLFQWKCSLCYFPRLFLDLILLLLFRTIVNLYLLILCLFPSLIFFCLFHFLLFLNPSVLFFVGFCCVNFNSLAIFFNFFQLYSLTGWLFCFFEIWEVSQVWKLFVNYFRLFLKLIRPRLHIIKRLLSIWVFLKKVKSFLWVAKWIRFIFVYLTINTLFFLDFFLSALGRILLIILRK